VRSGRRGLTRIPILRVHQNKAEILAELPNLNARERQDVFERLCELMDDDLLRGVGPTEPEKKLLEEAMAEFERDANPGIPWRDALREIRASSTR